MTLDVKLILDEFNRRFDAAEARLDWRFARLLQPQAEKVDERYSDTVRPPPLLPLVDEPYRDRREQSRGYEAPDVVYEPYRDRREQQRGYEAPDAPSFSLGIYDDDVVEELRIPARGRQKEHARESTAHDPLPFSLGFDDEDGDGDILAADQHREQALPQGAPGAPSSTGTADGDDKEDDFVLAGGKRPVRVVIDAPTVAKETVNDSISAAVASLTIDAALNDVVIDAPTKCLREFLSTDVNVQESVYAAEGPLTSSPTHASPGTPTLSLHTSSLKSQGTTVRVEYGDAAIAADPAGAHVIRCAFPCTYGQPIAHFLRKTAVVPDAKVISEHQAVRVGIVFCGRQSPGGRNVVLGL